MTQAIAPAETKLTETKQVVVAGASLISVMAARHNLEPQKFLSTLIKTVFPSDKQNPSNEQVAAFLAVAKQYDLNPFIKEIYAFPAKGGGIVPIVSIDGWSTLINRQPALDGIEFDDQFNGDGSLRGVTAIIHRKDRAHPTKITEYMSECARSTEPWTKWPARMLRHKALIQCARVAFGLAGIYDPDEAERIAEAEQVQIEPTKGESVSKADRLAARLQNQQTGAEDSAIDAELATEPEKAAAPEAPASPTPAIDDKKESKRLRNAIKNKIDELGWDEKRADKFFGGRDINAFSVPELTQLDRSLTEILAET